MHLNGGNFSMQAPEEDLCLCLSLSHTHAHTHMHRECFLAPVAKNFQLNVEHNTWPAEGGDPAE